jgi:hypothetical protein
MPSALFQKPRQERPAIERPTEGASPEAGFVAMLFRRRPAPCPTPPKNERREAIGLESR